MTENSAALLSRTCKWLVPNGRVWNISHPNSCANRILSSMITNSYRENLLLKCSLGHSMADENKAPKSKWEGLLSDSRIDDNGFCELQLQNQTQYWLEFYRQWLQLF